MAYHRVLALAGVPIFAQHNWNSKFWLSLQIFNFLVAILTILSTTAYCVVNIDDLPAFTEGACIWTTAVIMTISKTICLFFRNDFRGFVKEMCFVDTMLDVPLIQTVLKMEGKDGILIELKDKVKESQKNLLKLTKIMLKFYVTTVFLTAILYICSALFQMLVREDSQHILGTFATDYLTLHGFSSILITR